MPKDHKAFNSDVKATIDGIEHRAFENYLLDLVKGFGTAYDALRAKHGYREEKFLLLAARLEGEFPDTGIEMKFYRPVREEEGWTNFGIWRDPQYFDESFNRRVEPEDMAAEILRFFRGN